MSWRTTLLGKEYEFYKRHGERLYKEGSLREARIELERALDTLKRLKSTEEVELETLLEGISSKLTEGAIEKAKAFHADGDFDSALDYYQNALGMVKDSVLKDEIMMEISKIRQDKNPVEHIQTLEQDVQDNPEQTEKLFNLAMEYALSGYYERAIHELKKVYTLEPENDEVLLRLGNACSDAGRFLDAMDFYQQGIKLNSDNIVWLHLRMGQLYDVNQEYKDALNCYKKALEIDTEFIDALMAMGALYRKLNDPTNAIDCYEKVLGLDKEDYDTALLLASLWESTGYLKNAKELWQEIALNAKDVHGDEARDKLEFYETQF
jgi:tetratricopeptide (TPR) repeat protein